MIIATPDGISDADWDRVKELAVAIVNATQDDEEGGEEETIALMGFLDGLEAKYGPHPGILSTRADFLSDPDEAVAAARAGLHAGGRAARCAQPPLHRRHAGRHVHP